MSYPSDLTDAQWNLIEDLFIFKNGYGNRRIHDVRQTINAIFYIVKTGAQWRQLPRDFPHWNTVYKYFSRLKRNGTWERLNDRLVGKSRKQMGRDPKPSYALIDSQSIKTTGPADGRGIDGGKKVKGRKRHIVTDIPGHLLKVKIHAANIHDTVSGGVVFRGAVDKYPSLKGVCADAGYRKTFEEFVRDVMKKTVEIKERIVEQGWGVIQKRWIVERTFAWMNNYRRLSKDYEIRCSTENSFVYISHAILLLRRLTRPQKLAKVV